MPLCAYCGKKAGGIFSFRGFNEDTGRCRECDFLTPRLTLDRFQTKFHNSARSGTLTIHDWSELDVAAAVAGLDRKAALAYVRGNLFALVAMVLQDKGEAMLSQEELVQVLAIPEFYVEEARHVLSVLTNVPTLSGLVLGGSGYPIGVMCGCELEFASEKVFIQKLSDLEPCRLVASDVYADVISLQFGGRGAITSGGGWSGGGFGLSGIITGVVLAGALNQITTRSTVETIIYFRTTAGELILLNNQYTSEHLRIMLSLAITRIEAAQRRTFVSPPNVVEQLRELGQLRATGTITEDEFQRLKATLLKFAGAE